MKTRLLPVLTLLAPAFPAVAQRAAPPPPAGWPAFVRTFDAFAAGDSVVGGSVLVLRDGRVLAHHEYGFADRALGQRVDERTIFHWASITKTLTAVAVMQLRDRGRLSLDDHVARYLPELTQVHDTFGSMGDITIQMLLSHSAGFQDPTWPYKVGKPWEPFEPGRWEQLVAMMPYQEILFQPGTRYGYSNPAFIYLARIIEQLTGDPYQGYIYKNIWTPLAMTHSYFGATPYHLAAARSNNYTVVRDSAGRVSLVANGRDFDPGITIPNGGWNAPLGDVARWVAFLTASTGGDTVLARASLEEMWPAAGDQGQHRRSGRLGRPLVLRAVAGWNPVHRPHGAPGWVPVVLLPEPNTTNEADGERSESGFKTIRDAALDLFLR